MKKALFYSIRTDGMYGPRLVAITTERGGRWWGRDLRDDLGTNGRFSALAGRFETEDAARAKMKEVEHIRSHYQRQRRDLEDARRRLSHAEEQMIAQTCDGLPKRGAEMLSVSIVFSEHQVQP